MTDIEPGIAHLDAQAPSPPVEFYRGARKMTSETIRSMDLLAKGIPKNHGVNRYDAWQLAKQVATAKGVGSGAKVTLDALFSHSNNIDFSEGDDPIVWPSNKTLALATGKEESAVKKHLAELTQIGLIFPTDSHCVPRRGHRNDDGRIAEAHGISLSAFITRNIEYKKLVAEYQEHELLLHHGKSNRTNLIAEIKSMINAGMLGATGADWDSYRARLDVIREKEFKTQAELNERTVELELLLDECKNEFSDDEETAIETDELSIEIRTGDFEKPEKAADPSLKQSSADDEQTAEVKREEPENPPATQHKDEKWLLTSELIDTALPAVREALPNTESWQDFKNMAPWLAKDMGIGDGVWQEGTVKCGADLITAMVLLIFQKYTDGKIDKPGAYLRVLIKEAQEGGLRLWQSYHALARDKMAKDPEHQRNTGFPLERSIRYTPWYVITKEHVPEHSQHLHVDIVANAFRKAMRKENTDLTNPSIKDRYVNFCKAWRKGRKKALN